MASFRSFAAVPLAICCAFGTAAAQRHDVGSSPPTPPPPKAVVIPQDAVVDPLNSGLGALQLSFANSLVSAPQLLAVQLQSSNDRVRTSALAAIGAPGQYLSPGHVAFPHSVHLDFLALGDTYDIDAILTAEFDQHIVSAILIPEDEVWHRVATAAYATPFSTAATNPSTFVRTDRSLRNPQFYTAIFRTKSTLPDGDSADTEVHLRIVNGHAAVTMSFASAERTCDPTHQKPCDYTERWLQPSTTDRKDEVVLVTATGHVHSGDAGDPIAHAETYEAAHLRTFACQPFLFSDTSLHFEAGSAAAPCVAARDAPHEQPHDATHEPPQNTPHDTQHDQPLH